MVPSPTFMSPTCSPHNGTALVRMYQYLRIATFWLLKCTAIFALSRYLTRDRLRILCYHGISIGDEHDYSPILFMRQSTFARRMRMLAASGWRIVDLDTAVLELTQGRLKKNTIAVTIDDGWLSTFTHAVPVLRNYEIPATLYVTTYYCDKNADVFNVAVYYMLWKTQRASAKLSTGCKELDGEYDLRGDKYSVGTRWIEIAETEMDWQQRQGLLPVIADALGMRSEDVFHGQRFRMMSSDQVTDASRLGIDIQLHTHRHRLPAASVDAMESEVSDNKRLLDVWAKKDCRHFCYPSGRYTVDHPLWLANMGLSSSTTCDPGTNEPGMDPHRLRRILDRETWSEIELEAAMSGYSDVLNKFFRGHGDSRR